MKFLWNSKNPVGRRPAGTSALIKASHLFLFRCQIVLWRLVNISEHSNQALFRCLNEELKFKWAACTEQQSYILLNKGSPPFHHRNSFISSSGGSCVFRCDCCQQTPWPAGAAWKPVQPVSSTLPGVQRLMFKGFQGPPNISSLSPAWTLRRLMRIKNSMWGGVGDGVLFRKHSPGSHRQGNLTSPSWERPTKYFLTLAGVWFIRMF